MTSFTTTICILCGAFTGAALVDLAAEKHNAMINYPDKYEHCEDRRGDGIETCYTLTR